MTNKDGYILGRSYSASVRLNAQHAYWVETFGYLIHPSIPTSSDGEGLSILDVGTGTGNWIMAVQHELKVPIKTLIGCDISDVQFPHDTWLPEKVKMIELDALDPNGPPEELRGQFDIVHARLLMSLIKDKPDQLISFFSKLLKPGGCLQWSEPCNNEIEIQSLNGSSTEGLNFMMKVLKGQRPWDWLEKIDEILEPLGYEDIKVDRREPLPWQRGWYVDNWCMVVDEFAEQLGLPAAELKELNRKAVEESRQGSWIKQQLQTVVARKKKP